MSVRDQQWGGNIDRNWQKPAAICVALALLGSLLTGAIWLNAQSRAAGRSTIHGYPEMPTVPLTIGFYDLENKSAANDPVLKQFARMHLDFVILQNLGIARHSVSDMLGMTAAMSGLPLPGVACNNNIFSMHPFNYVDVVEAESASYPGVTAPGPQPEAVQNVVPNRTVPGIGIWVESKVNGRVLWLASVNLPAAKAKQAFESLEKRWESLAAAPNPLPPIIVGLDTASKAPLDEFVQSGSGWFDAGGAFWNSAAFPLAGHLIFSSGWSCTAGRVVEDPSDLQHRCGYVVTTAGAASPATHPAGDGDD